MNQFIQKYKQSLKQIGLFTVSIFVLYLVFIKCFTYIAPFFIAWVLSLILDPIVRFLQKKLKFPRVLATLVSIFIGLGVVGLAGTGIVMRLIKEAVQFTRELPYHIESIQIIIEKWIGKTQNFYITLPTSIQDVLKNSIKSVITTITSAVGPGVGKGSISIVSFVPNFLVVFFITLISLFFFSYDREKIHTFMYKQIPKSWLSTYGLLKKAMVGALFGYAKAQLTLMIFVMLICIIGLTIVGYEYSLFLGVLIGFLDALPFIGTGAVLIPWAIWKGLMGDIPYAFGLAITYASVVVVRQLLEPKILSHHIGLYPLVTIMSMYIGAKVLGVAGIILGPIFVIIIKTLQEIQLLPQWKQ
ncbi:MAG: sporulation integral membrane protein YtvI [Epulopiscium sp.]|nr:sporulation integral membrane protein YtvI [Candidatus Epulonipiscium sp.]